MYLLQIRIKAFLIRIIQTRRKYLFETCRADIQNKGQRKRNSFYSCPIILLNSLKYYAENTKCQFYTLLYLLPNSFQGEHFRFANNLYQLSIIVKSFYKKIYCIICLKYNTSDVSNVIYIGSQKLDGDLNFYL